MPRHVIRDEGFVQRVFSRKIFGVHAQELELRHGSKVELGRYVYRVDALVEGGRKDYKLGMSYEDVPSPLFLKRLVPKRLQRALRMRRSHERIVR